MTFIYELDQYRMCENELPTSRLSKAIVWQTYIHTDRQTERKLYTIPLLGWSKISCSKNRKANWWNLITSVIRATMGVCLSIILVLWHSEIYTGGNLKTPVRLLYSGYAGFCRFIFNNSLYRQTEQFLSFSCTRKHHSKSSLFSTKFTTI